MSQSPSRRDSASEALPSDLKPVTIALRRERVDPGGDGASDPRIGARWRVLADRRGPVGERDRVRRAFAAGLDRQLDDTAATVRGHETRREPEDRSDVDRLIGAGWAPGPLVAPARKLAEDRHQRAGTFGQLVVDARRYLAIALPGEHPVGDHAVQPRAQLLGGDSGQHTLELDEPARAGREITDDQEGPLVSDKVERARIGGPLIVRVAFGGWSLRNKDAPCGGRTCLLSSSVKQRTLGR